MQEARYAGVRYVLYVICLQDMWWHDVWGWGNDPNTRSGPVPQQIYHLVGRLIRAGSVQLAWTDWIGLNRAREFLSVGRLSG